MKKKVFVKPSAQTVQCEATTILATSGNISDGGANGRNSREMNPTSVADDSFFLN